MSTDTNTNDNADTNDNEVARTITGSTGGYEDCIRRAHTALGEGALDVAFQWYSQAVCNAYRITLLLSDDDNSNLSFWRIEMSNAQQLATALAVLLKARNMALPTW